MLLKNLFSVLAYINVYMCQVKKNCTLMIFIFQSIKVGVALSLCTDGIMQATLCATFYYGAVPILLWSSADF